jgi:tripartite-type tricarboxylate transporter receptor subunit TctC
MDVSARILATELEKVLGTTIVVVNKPGAATVLGTDAAVRAKKDGYTILITGTSALTKQVLEIAIRIGLRKQ